MASLSVVGIGEVHLLRRQENGTEFILQRATAGTMLAEASLIATRYHCAAVAASNAVMTAYSRAQVLDMIEPIRYPARQPPPAAKRH